MNSTQIGACAQASSDIIKRLGLVGKYVSSRDYRTGANLCRLCKGILKGQGRKKLGVEGYPKIVLTVWSVNWTD